MYSTKSKLQALTVCLIFCVFPIFLKAKTVVTTTTCEYHNNPIGIDIASPRLSWKLVSDEKNVKQIAYEIRIAKQQADLNKKSKQWWNSGKVESAQSVNVEYKGPALQSMERMYWQVRVWDNKNQVSKWSEPAFWETGILQSEQWEADWISLQEEAVPKESSPAHYYRTEFSSAKKVKQARAYVSALGLYELYLNGKKVGDQLFTPGWTSYNKRLQYQVYDVTVMLEKDNTIGAILGDGWYRGFLAWGGQRNYYGDQLALLIQLEIDYTDGTSQTITSNKSWKVNYGPIRTSDIYNGEVYDANFELEDWNRNGFNDNEWKSVAILEKSKEVLMASQGAPVKAIEEIEPQEQITTPKGEMVYDMGQNMVGWLRIKMKGNKGDTIQLKFAEVLDKDGNFYTENLRAAKCTDTYVFAEDGEVEYEPTFTFHGFRYVELLGLNYTPELKDLSGVVIHSLMKPTGKFTCSNEMINQLQHNIQWGQKGNFLDVPTDCPQRDERLGWTGDAQVFAPTAAFNYDVAAFYTKWMKDLMADQLENGVVPHVIPDVLKGAGGATGWSDAVAIIPWAVYQSYGDIRILDESYPAIIKWINYMEERAGADLIWDGDDHFGDWLAFATTRSDYPGATTEKDLIATAYFYFTTTLAAKMATIIGKESDAVRLGKMISKIKEAFNQEFVTPNGRLVSHTQTAYVLALAFDILPETLKENAADYLAENVESFKHLTTGFLGTPLLCPVLSAIGRDDLAFMLLSRDEYPSWLYPVTQGATTIWERWDGQKPDGTFQHVGMNSFNHYAYGAIGEWLYTYVAGIKVDETNPGYKKFYLAPHPGGELTKVNAEFESMYGKIVSDWKIENGKMVYKIEIPANTSAQVVLPQAKLQDVDMQNAVKENCLQKGNEVFVELGSGTYTFSYPCE